ncbi:5593_t:CDS:2 [Dentiscutata erythropus]|uniref:5593_t:CDS:1 n=1 Tax=Dentiscutata erythropus TaxID=1348616 RepID=A0A9N9H0U6_9GLOM|nr:5593_t:CDS:2 [Dentiscutata erythropus]
MSEEQINEAVNTLKSSGNYTPLVSIVTTHVTEVLEIDISAQYNKKICGALIERVRSVEYGIRILLRRKSELEENFKKEDYLDNFENFTKTLINIKKFVADITQFQKFRFFKVDEVKENFLQLTKRFDTCMGILGFTIVTDQEKLKEIDNESLKDDLNEMTEFLAHIEGFQEYQEISADSIELPRISPTQLQNPNPNKNLQVNKPEPILKRILLPDNREVRCKSFLNDISQVQNTLEILLKASVTSELEPKLTNFQFARMKDDVTTYINQDRESLRWMAPEKMLDYEKENIVRYTYQCELFSFGMLLWELVFEKTPYAGKKLDDVITHVTKGEREEIAAYSSDKSEDIEIYQEFVRIIESVWAHRPEDRISPNKLFIELSNLKKKYASDKITMPLSAKKQSAI